MAKYNNKTKQDSVSNITDKEGYDSRTNNSSKKNRKSNRNSRNQFRSSKDDKKEVFKPTNTASMYFSDLSLAEQTTRFSFNQFLGDAKTLTVFGNRPPSTVLTLEVNPSPGLTTGADDAGVNIAGRRTYTKLSAGNAKTTNYAPQDVTTLILAVGEIISMIEAAKRAFRVVYTYDVRNKSIPLGIIRAMGFDPEMCDEGKIGPLRIDLNVAINSFNQIPIMKNVSYLAKCAEVFANYYSDSESRMAQYYLFTPHSTWLLDETGSEEGTVLRTKPVLTGCPGNQQKMSDFIKLIKDMIRAISDSSTFGYIYSDILRLVPPESQYKVALLMENEILLPVYDPMKLLQIHNSTAAGLPTGSTYTKGKITPNNDVYPNVNNNSIEYLPSFAVDNAFLMPYMDHEVIIDFPHSMGDPDLDQRVDITRYQSIIYTNEDNSTNLFNSTIPDHYIVDYLMFFNTNHWKTFTSRVVHKETGSSVPTSGLLTLISDLQKFDYHPFVRCEYSDTSEPSTTVNVLCGDIDFFTTVDVKYLDRMNDLCYQGLLEFRE